MAGGGLFASRHRQEPHHHVALHAAAIASDPVEFLEDLGGTPNSRLIAFDVNGVVAGRHADPECLANSAEVLVSRPENGAESF
jgi:hypothetical protein